MMLVLKFAFIVSGLMIIGVVIRVPTQAQQPVSPVFELAVTAMGLTSAVAGLCGRGYFRGVLKRTSTGWRASTLLSQWITANVFSLGFIESCILYGVFLHFVGARARSTEVLFVVAIIALVIWSPGTPPAAKEDTPS
jgi:hypothetical protein